MKLTDPVFHDADKAREWLEAQRWPNGPICPHCGNSDPLKIRPLEGKANYRPGLYKCYAAACRKQFSVMVNTHMERSHVAANIWVIAMFLMSNAKKSVSARQMSRMMDVPLKTVWFVCHRIRAAMGDDNPGPMGGEGKIVEADESWFGGKTHNRAFNKAKAPKKQIVMTLVDRDSECRFSLMKRSVFGAHHSISEAHLFRRLREWDFRWNSRHVTDGERTAMIVRQCEGKRLMYQRPAATKDA
jgi:hypothetical protein